MSWLDEYNSLSEEEQAAVGDAVVAAKNALREHGINPPLAIPGLSESITSFVKGYYENIPEE